LGSGLTAYSLGAGLEARVWRLGRGARGLRARGSRFVRRSGLGARARVWTWARTWGSGLGLGARSSRLGCQGSGLEALGSRLGADSLGWGLEACVWGFGSGSRLGGSGLGARGSGLRARVGARGSGLRARGSGSGLRSRGSDLGWFLTARDSRLGARGSGLRVRGNCAGSCGPRDSDKIVMPASRAAQQWSQDAGRRYARPIHVNFRARPRCRNGIFRVEERAAAQTLQYIINRYWEPARQPQDSSSS
jgi:hypothetical protein